MYIYIYIIHYPLSRPSVFPSGRCRRRQRRRRRRRRGIKVSDVEQFACTHSPPYTYARKCTAIVYRKYAIIIEKIRNINIVRDETFYFTTVQCVTTGRFKNSSESSCRAPIPLRRVYKIDY